MIALFSLELPPLHHCLRFTIADLKDHAPSHFVEHFARVSDDPGSRSSRAVAHCCAYTIYYEAKACILYYALSPPSLALPILPQFKRLFRCSDAQAGESEKRQRRFHPCLPWESWRRTGRRAQVGYMIWAVHLLEHDYDGPLKLELMI